MRTEMFILNVAVLIGGVVVGVAFFSHFGLNMEVWSWVEWALLGGTWLGVWATKTWAARAIRRRHDSSAK